jgi:phosphopantetheinyl transferase (holo-ACP synthase)
VIGNDIVDLRFVDFPAYCHVNYLERVCTPAEAWAIRHSADPCTSLAIVWAAKEAAYKSVSTQMACRYFNPRRFDSGFVGWNGRNGAIQMSVTFAGDKIAATVTIADRYVHAVATVPETKLVCSKIGTIENPFSKRIHPRQESEAARLLASDLLRSTGRADLVLKFSERVPILCEETGARSEVEIGLSHHGAYCAVAIASGQDGAPPNVELNSNIHGDFFVEESCSTFTA